MTASQIIFYMLAVFVLATALLSVTSNKIFRAASWLLFSLMGIAGLYFWMNVAFVAAVQVIVYVGGIVVLILFSIFLTHQSGRELPVPVRGRRLIAAAAVGCTGAFTYFLLYRHVFAVDSNTDFKVEVAAIGTRLLSTTQYGYVLPFEVISMLLLAALVGCIVIAITDEKTNHS